MSEIPLFLQPYTADHYLIPELTATGISELLQVITQDMRIPQPREEPRAWKLRIQMEITFSEGE